MKIVFKINLDEFINKAFVESSMGIDANIVESEFDQRRRLFEILFIAGSILICDDYDNFGNVDMLYPWMFGFAIKQGAVAGSLKLLSDELEADMNDIGEGNTEIDNLLNELKDILPP